MHRLRTLLLLVAVGGLLAGTALSSWVLPQSGQSGAGKYRSFTYQIQHPATKEVAVVVPPGEFVLTDARVSREAQVFWAPVGSQSSSSDVRVTIVRANGEIVPFGTMSAASATGHLFDRSGIALRGGDQIQVWGSATTPGLLVTFTGFVP